MPLSRRSMLHAMGILGAAQTIPFLACKKTPEVNHPTPPDGPPVVHGPVVTVIFEGPWLLTRNGNNLVATTFGDLTLGLGTSHGPIPHSCSAGGWDSKTGFVGYPVASGTPAIYTVNKGSVWTGKLGNRNPTTATFGQILTKPVAGPTIKPVYFSNSTKTLKKLVTDRQVILPLPDGVCFGGQLMNAKVTDSTSGKPVDIDMKPCIATILQYTQPSAGSLGTELNFTSSDGALTTPLKATNGSPLIFKMVHDASFDATGDVAHVIGAFQELLKRVGLSNIGITATDVLADTTAVCGITPAQMGTQKFVPPLPPGTPRLMVGSMANCAGGGLALDCC